MLYQQDIEAKTNQLRTALTDTNAAIAAKGGTRTAPSITAIPVAVQSIPTGGKAVIQKLTVTNNGNYEAPFGVDGYNPVTVNVPSSGGSVAPFSRIKVKTWTPSTDTMFYHVDSADQAGLAYLALFCMGDEVGNTGIHSASVVVDPKYDSLQYGQPVGSWSGKSFALTHGFAAYNYPEAGDFGDDGSAVGYRTGATYIVIMAYGPL